MILKPHMEFRAAGSVRKMRTSNIEIFNLPLAVWETLFLNVMNPALLAVILKTETRVFSDSLWERSAQHEVEHQIHRQ